MKISVETTQNVVIDYETASVGDRILAYLIDAAIVVAYVIILLIIVSNVVNNGEAGGTIIIIGIIPVLFYDLLFEIAMDGQSPGKKAMDIKVIDMAGQQPTVGQYFLRWLLRLVDFSILSGVVAIISISASGKGQRVGDIVAGTTVVKTKRKVGFSNVLFPKFDHDYVVEFPQVAQLTDQDINIVKEVIRKYRRSRNREAVVLMVTRIEEVLGVSSDRPGPKFLERIVKDYHHLSSQG